MARPQTARALAECTPPDRAPAPSLAVGCGFGVWPTFGLQALKWTWNFDWNQGYM